MTCFEPLDPFRIFSNSTCEIILLFGRKIVNLRQLIEIYFSAIIWSMAAGKRKRTEKSIFASIRKPTAPPTKMIGEDKPEEKIHPSERKVKHKKKLTADE